MWSCPCLASGWPGRCLALSSRHYASIWGLTAGCRGPCSIAVIHYLLHYGKYGVTCWRPCPGWSTDREECVSRMMRPRYACRSARPLRPGSTASGGGQPWLYLAAHSRRRLAGAGRRLRAAPGVHDPFAPFVARPAHRRPDSGAGSHRSPLAQPWVSSTSAHTGTALTVLALLISGNCRREGPAVRLDRQPGAHGQCRHHANERFSRRVRTSHTRAWCLARLFTACERLWRWITTVQQPLVGTC